MKRNLYPFGDIMIIRLATVGDIDKIRDMHQSYLQCSHSREYFENHIDTEDPLVLIAEVLGKIIGYLVSRREGNWIHLVSMAVSPLERVKGVGRGMTLELHSMALERGITGIYGHVRESNLVAQRLYRSTGFNFKWISEYEDGDGKLEFSLSNLIPCND